MNNPLVRNSGKYQWDCKVKGIFKSEQKIILVTVFCDDIDDARCDARTVVESMGYTECTVNKIVKRGQAATVRFQIWGNSL